MNNRTPDLREIERAYPIGTIYTIYSLNLRYLFEINEEKKLRAELDKIRLKDKIITWVKARYLQIQFEKFDDKKRSQLIGMKGRDFNDNPDTAENSGTTENGEESQDIYGVKENVREYLNEKINKNGEVLYFFQGDNLYNHVCEIDDNYKIEITEEDELTIKEKEPKKAKETIFDILYDFEIKLKNAESSQYKTLVESAKKDIDKHFAAPKKLVESADSDTVIRSGNDKTQSPSNEGSEKKAEILTKLNDLHSQINEKRLEIKSKLYKETRKAEKFLASDEFAKFSEDPFFKISKNLFDNQYRIIELNNAKRPLLNATEEERKVIENGHEFAIFRGHLKTKWLNSVTYKVESKNKKVKYYIRLSRSGILQIRKEEELSGNDRLIDVLTSLLKSQQKYSNGKDISQNEDILQVAVGFAKLLEFQTTSNFLEDFKREDSKREEVIATSAASKLTPKNSKFESLRIIPLELKEAKARYKSLEREKYIILFLTKLKKNRVGTSVFSPEDLDKLPSAISCILQGSLVLPDTKTNIKIYQHDKRLETNGEFDQATLTEIGANVNKTYSLEGIKEKKKKNKKLNDDEKKIWKALSDYYVIPETSGEKNDQYTDLSTWKNELCIFKPERGLIFFDGNLETLEFGRDFVSYADYWKSIVRGVEYTVALRATLQILESRTTRLLDKIPDIIKLSTPKNDKEGKNSDDKTNESEETDFKKAQEMRQEMAEDLASLLKILPSLRSIAVSTRAFRSGHSVKKFEFIYENCFHFTETFENIQKNIDELSDFLTFFEQQHLQLTIDAEAKREKRQDRVLGIQDRKLNIIALIFTIATIIYVFPSFVHDFSEWKWIQNEVWKWVTENIGAICGYMLKLEGYLTLLFVIILVLILFVCYRLWNYPDGKISKFLQIFFPDEPKGRKE